MNPSAPRVRALARRVRRSLLIAVCGLSLLFSGAQALAQGGAETMDLREALRSERARPRPTQFARTQFLATPAMLGAWLSPDGGHIAYLHERSGRREVWQMSTAGGPAKKLLAQTQASDLLWSRDGRWLLLQTDRGIEALATAGQPGSGLILGVGGKRARDLFGRDRSRADAMLVLESPPKVSREIRLWRILRVDVRRRTQVLWQDTRPIVDFEVDGAGRLAWLSRAEGEQQVVYRVQGKTLQPRLRCVRVERCGFLSASTDGNSLYLNTDAQAGFGRLARLDQSGHLLTLHADPAREADLQHVSLDPLTGQPVFAAYRSTRAAVYGLDDTHRAALQRLRAQVAETDLRVEVGQGAGARWLVHARSAQRKGERLYIFDPVGGQVRRVLDDLGYNSGKQAVAALPSSQLARKLAVSWRASDGMLLHGFVLLPPGVDAARAPVVANIHGGPFNLFRPEFSAQSQLLANRGYVVFEPNFRGSTGLGRDYLLAAQGDFGNGRVQQDIVEGVRWLLAQGVGDAQRVGILGASFGGYSALQGVTFQPELFRAGVAAVPPADFGWVLRWYARGPDQMSRGVPMATTMRLLSLDPADAELAERLRAQSPIAHAADLRRPVLLLAGGDDERVPIRSVVHYAARLQSLGKDVTLFVDAEGRHQLANPTTREAYLYLLEAMFQRHLGGPAPAPPSRALRDTLAKNLLLDGDKLRPR